MVTNVISKKYIDCTCRFCKDFSVCKVTKVCPESCTKVGGLDRACTDHQPKCTVGRLGKLRNWFKKRQARLLATAHLFLGTTWAISISKSGKLDLESMLAAVLAVYFLYRSLEYTK